MNLVVAAIQLDHREANSSVTKFLVELLESAKSSKSSLQVKAIVAKILREDGYGPKLLETVFNGALFQLPSYFVPDMADVFWQLLSWDREVCDFQLLRPNVQECSKPFFSLLSL